jgi:peptidyl-prolyl cis-trans isomerase B (cyclophilin B)
MILSLALALVATGFTGCGAAGNDEVAVLETKYGRIVYEFLPEYAPKHAEAFKAMIRNGDFDGTKFHRVIKNKIIQGGDPNSKDDDPSDDGLGQPGQATIPAEFSTEIKHTRGIVSAARKGDNKDSATSQFFICLGNEPAYDGNYTVFGRVIEGMNVVALISDAPVGAGTGREKPLEPVAITRAYLSTRSALGIKPAETK